VTNEITLSKAEFALAINNAGLDVRDYIPGRITPPVIVMNSGSPYIQSGTLGGEYSMNLDCICVAMTADNEEATEGLDALLADFLNAMEPLGYAVLSQVGQPYTLAANNAEYLAANVAVNILITI
jgi:hypothetical protein